MSVAYFIVLDNEDPGFDPFVNGKFLAQETKRLARVAASLGVQPLDAYVSYDPAEARGMIEDVGGDPEEVEIPEEQWFDPDEGLAYVARLTEHLKAKPAAVKNSKGVLADLQEYQQVLSKAKSIGARWHLAVDF